MSNDIWIELIRTIPSLATLAGVVYGIRISLGSRRVVERVEQHTNGLVSRLTDAAEAKGVESGHAAGVAAGFKEGVQSEQKR